MAKKEKSIRVDYNTPLLTYAGFFSWLVLCFLPLIALYVDMGFLNRVLDLQRIEFSPMITYIFMAIVVVAAVVFMVDLGRINSNVKGNLLTIGLYRIIRHPMDFSLTIILLSIPILLSRQAPFTILSVAGILIIITVNYYIDLQEEKINLKKWGKKYEKYMHEVPRWNFIKGLINLRKGLYH